MRTLQTVMDKTTWLLFAALLGEAGCVPSCLSSPPESAARPAEPSAAAVARARAAPPSEPTSPGVEAAAVVDAATAAGAEPQSPTAPAASASSISIDSFLELIARRELLPVSLASAPEKLRALGPLVQRQPVPELTQLVGPEHGRVRTEITYSQDAKGGWSFSQATFTLVPEPPSATAALYAQTTARLRQSLGAALSERTHDGELFPRVTWRLGRRTELLLHESDGAQPGVPAGTRCLVIDVARPEVDSD